MKIIEDIGIRLLIASDSSSMSSLVPGFALYHEMTATWPGSASSSGGAGLGSGERQRLHYMEAVTTARSCIRVLGRLSTECASMFVYTSGSIKHLEDIICNVLGRMPPVLCEELLVSIAPLFATWLCSRLSLTASRRSSPSVAASAAPSIFVGVIGGYSWLDGRVSPNSRVVA